MLSIHNTLPTQTITRNLSQHTRTQSSAMEKLSSGFRINKAADDPAGMIMSEQLQAQIAGLDRAIKNTEDADSLMGIMEGGLAQVQNILRKMQSLAVKANNTGVTSAEQVGADQAELDNALLAIGNIMNSTNYGGRKLLNDMNMFSSSNARPVDENGEIVKGGGGNALGALSRDPTKLGIDTQLTVEGVGANGDEAVTLEFKKGQSLEDVLKQLKELDLTQGPPAEAEDGGVSESGEGDSPSLSGQLFGSLSVNAGSIANLKNLTDEEGLSSLSEMLSGASTPYISNSGKEFDLGKLSKSDQALLELSDTLGNLGLGSIGGYSVGTGKYDEDGNEILSSYSLNDLFSGGDASLTRDPALALKIIKAASSDIASTRAQIGATRAMREHEKMAKQAELENVTKMDSMIRDTDMADTMVEYAKSSVLAQVGTKLLRDAVDNSKMILDLFA